MDLLRGLKVVILCVYVNYLRNDIVFGVFYRFVINRCDERYFIYLFKEERLNKI